MIRFGITESSLCDLQLKNKTTLRIDASGFDLWCKLYVFIMEAASVVELVCLYLRVLDDFGVGVEVNDSLGA